LQKLLDTSEEKYPLHIYVYKGRVFLFGP